MKQFSVQRAGASRELGYGRGWVATNNNTGTGGWFPTWREALDFAQREALDFAQREALRDAMRKMPLHAALSHVDVATKPKPRFDLGATVEHVARLEWLA